MNHFAKNRKQLEQEHYDALAKRWRGKNSQSTYATDVHGVNHALYSSYQFLEKWLTRNCKGKKVLDYGCGNGIHSITPLTSGAKKFVGIDISDKSLEIAKKRVKIAGYEDKAQFINMDCEHLTFPNANFDIVMDGGTFSSLDLGKALPELARVLSPNGKVIGIETLGHNPFTNLKRKLNVVAGTRTAWAAAHILTIKDFTRMRAYFNRIEIRYFHLLVLFAIPFRKIPGSAIVIKILDIIDRILLSLPFLKKYAFKVVFVLSQPQKVKHS